MWGRGYFDITRIMRVEERAEEAQASMRACRFVPLPDMRTVSLWVGSHMEAFAETIRCKEG